MSEPEVMRPMRKLGGRFYWASRSRFLYPGLYVGQRRILPLPGVDVPGVKFPLVLKLVEFPEQTVVIAKHQPEYAPLPAHIFPGDPNGRICCCWKLTWRQRLTLLCTGRIWHEILTFRQPLQPQLLRLDKPEMRKEGK